VRKWVGEDTAGEEIYRLLEKAPKLHKNFVESRKQPEKGGLLCVRKGPGPDQPTKGKWDTPVGTWVQANRPEEPTKDRPKQVIKKGENSETESHRAPRGLHLRKRPEKGIGRECKNLDGGVNGKEVRGEFGG